MHIKAENHQSARSLFQLGDVTPSSKRGGRSWSGLRKITTDCKEDLTILVWPGTPCRRRKQRKLAFDNLWLASHRRRGTGLAVITKVNNAFPASNGVTPFANKFDSIYVPGMWNVASPRSPRVHRTRKRRDRYDNHGFVFCYGDLFRWEDYISGRVP